MECFDARANVYYPRHAEYVGPRNDLRGRCVRCGEITDAAAAKEAERREEIASRPKVYQRRPDGTFIEISHP